MGRVVPIPLPPRAWHYGGWTATVAFRCSIKSISGIKGICTSELSLFMSKGHCPYMPSKLAKYGMKACVASHVISSYAWKMSTRGSRAVEAKRRTRGCRVCLTWTGGLRGWRNVMWQFPLVLWTGAVAPEQEHHHGWHTVKEQVRASTCTACIKGERGLLI